MRLNINAVTENFKTLSALTDDELDRYMGMIRSAQGYFERLLMRDFISDDECHLCEHACAAKAYYDYTVFMAATSKTYSSQSGSVFAKVSDNRSVKNAETLMYNALAALPEGLVRDNGFMFERTNG
ncbi:MAG: hypothetical protein IJ424_07410 [Oscillospiraceae bacterium]|nr:hypothetical protein [Oscillospiraceae bacterium]